MGIHKSIPAYPRSARKPLTGPRSSSQTLASQPSWPRLLLPSSAMTTSSLALHWRREEWLGLRRAPTDERVREDEALVRPQGIVWRDRRNHEVCGVQPDRVGGSFVVHVSGSLFYVFSLSVHDNHLEEKNCMLKSCRFCCENCHMRPLSRKCCPSCRP